MQILLTYKICFWSFWDYLVKLLVAFRASIHCTQSFACPIFKCLAYSEQANSLPTSCTQLANDHSNPCPWPRVTSPFSPNPVALLLWNIGEKVFQTALLDSALTVPVTLAPRVLSQVLMDLRTLRVFPWLSLLFFTWAILSLQNNCKCFISLWYPQLWFVHSWYSEEYDFWDLHHWTLVDSMDMYFLQVPQWWTSMCLFCWHLASVCSDAFAEESSQPSSILSQNRGSPFRTGLLYVCRLLWSALAFRMSLVALEKPLKVRIFRLLKTTHC